MSPIGARRSLWEKLFRLDARCPYVYGVVIMPGRRQAASAPLVLIADDNQDTREMYALYLSRLGYRVETAVDGHQAIIKARAVSPHVVVMDLQMPKVDGWGAIRELQNRAETAGIPVIVLTGHDFKNYLKPAALAAGAVSYLMKPCFPDQLEREIRARIVAPQRRSATAL
jgi:CheY-like chemotaxis protein